MMKWKHTSGSWIERIQLADGLSLTVGCIMHPKEFYYFYKVFDLRSTIKYQSIGKAKEAAEKLAKKLLTEALKNLDSRCAKCE